MACYLVMRRLRDATGVSVGEVSYHRKPILSGLSSKGHGGRPTRPQGVDRRGTGWHANFVAFARDRLRRVGVPEVHIESISLE